jgi:hypothetical protein
VFDGRKISGLDENGATVFSHEYSFVEPASIAGMMNGYLYRTEDADAGEFEYFFLLPDTPDTTFHTEFRYGSDPEAMMLYNEGSYAYWLAAGILADRDEQMVQDVIDLFKQSVNMTETGPLQASGVEMVVDKGSKEIKSLKINGKEVDPNAEYKVATTEFLSKGGDNYSALGKGEVLGTMGITRDVFVDYLKANKDMAAPKAGRMIKE